MFNGKIRKSTIDMVIFRSYVSHYQRVIQCHCSWTNLLCRWVGESWSIKDRTVFFVSIFLLGRITRHYFVWDVWSVPKGHSCWSFHVCLSWVGKIRHEMQWYPVISPNKKKRNISTAHHTGVAFFGPTSKATIQVELLGNGFSTTMTSHQGETFSHDWTGPPNLWPSKTRWF